MDAITDPAVREIWVMKSAQIGWTEICLNTLGYFVDQDPSPILLVQPTLDIAEAFSKDRLAPMVRDTPALTRKIADAKSRDSGNTLLHKQFPGGHITLGGANSPAGLAMRPIRVVIFDEVDKYPASAAASGDPISLGRKRTTAFWNRKVLAGSTPTIKGSSRVELGFSGSDQRFYLVPCPKCDKFQRLVWAQVKWAELNLEPRQAVYQCVHCGALLTDSDRREMILRGTWEASKPANGIAGFHVNELMSPFVSIEEMVVNFLEAKKLPETLQTFINESLGESWEEEGDTVETAGVMARREQYTKASLPSGALLLTAGTDVQDDRLETTVWAWGTDEEAWRVEHFILRGDPGGTSIWAEHDQHIDQRYRTDDGRELLIEACCVDSGGHYTEQVYRYCAKRKRKRVWAIKGIGGANRHVWPKRPSRGGKVRVDLWVIGVDTIKDVLYGRLRKVLKPADQLDGEPWVATPGYVHLDADVDQEWADQLTSEVVVHRISHGRRIRAWKPRQTGSRQEALDCSVYAYAAMVGRGGGRLLAQRIGVTYKAPPRAQTTASAESTERPALPTPKPPRARPAGSWVHRKGSWLKR